MTHHTSSKRTSFFLLTGILLIALCLRGLITGVAPVIELIKVQYQLHTVALSMLTVLPLIAFATISPFASRMGQHFGLELTLFFALIFMILGSVIRGVEYTPLLFLGTAIIGVGIALANVLLPGLLKRHFPNHITTVTSAYVLMMGVGATVCAGSTVPMAYFADSSDFGMAGWAFSLICLSAIPIIALIIWIPQIKSANQYLESKSNHTHKYLWRSKEAWSITVFMGLNALLMYTFIAWLPTILSENGYTEQDAGIIYGSFQFFSILPAFVLPPLMKLFSNKRIVSIKFVCVVLVGILGLIILPDYSLLWSSAIGFGAGGGFIIAMSLLSLRTNHSSQAAALSGMTQCIGYSIAAIGPIFTGALHTATGSWQVPLLCCFMIALIWCYFAYTAVDNTIINNEELLLEES